MRKMILLLALLATPVLAEEPQAVSPHTWSTSSSTLIPSIQPAQNLIVSCGNGQVTISLKTGAVTFKDCEPDEGARRFWDAVEHMFPGHIPH